MPNFRNVFDAQPIEVKKKKRGCGCVIAIIVAAIVAFFVIMNLLDEFGWI